MSLGKLRHESKYLAVKYFYEEKGWSISWMCEQLAIAHSAYYKWKHREIPTQEAENEKIASLIVEYDEKFGHILGYRRMTQWINRLNQTNYNRKRIHRIMKKLNIHSVIRPKKKKYLKSSPQTIADNIFQRNFNADKPNEKWSTDVTEFKIPKSSKKIYLSAILDLYDRSIVSYVLGKSNNNALVFKTFDKAIQKCPYAKPMLHSDRGFQYTSKSFKAKLKKQGAKQSMSRVGKCIDNGPVEGLWGIIKSEMYAMNDIYDEESLIQAIDKYIHFYNTERFQERFDCQTPMEVRQAALVTANPIQYPIAENKRIKKFKEKFSA